MTYDDLTCNAMELDGIAVLAWIVDWIVLGTYPAHCGLIRQRTEDVLRYEPVQLFGFALQFICACACAWVWVWVFKPKST